MCYKMKNGHASFQEKVFGINKFIEAEIFETDNLCEFFSSPNSGTLACLG